MNKYLLLSINIIVFCFNFSISNANAQDYKTLDEWSTERGEYKKQFGNYKIPPSFDCNKSSTWDENRVCFEGLNLSSLDNLFSDYYQFVMKNINDKDKENIILIADTLRKKRERTGEECFYFVSESLNSCISDTYKTGIADLTDFLFFYQNGKYIKHYKKLFGDISLQDLKRSWQYEESEPAADLLRDFASHNLINLNGSLKAVSPNFGNFKGNDLKYTTYKAWEELRQGYMKHLNINDIPPSFNCNASLESDESYICYEGLNLPSLDNLFNDYYQFIMKNVDENDKSNVIRIAKKLLKERTALSVSDSAEYRWRKFFDPWEKYEIDLSISDVYRIGISDLTDFLTSYQNGKYIKYYRELFGNRNVEEMKHDWKYINGTVTHFLYDFATRGLINLDGTLKIVSPKAKTIDDVKQLQK